MILIRSPELSGTDTTRMWNMNTETRTPNPPQEAASVMSGQDSHALVLLAVLWYLIRKNKKK